MALPRHVSCVLAARDPALVSRTLGLSEVPPGLGLLSIKFACCDFDRLDDLLVRPLMVIGSLGGGGFVSPVVKSITIGFEFDPM